MIVHVFNDQKKFSQGYFKMLADNGVNLEEMLLLHYGKKDSFFSDLGLKTKYISNFFNPFSNLKLIRPLLKADKIIVHSLASPYLLFLIALFPSLGEKINWVIWGKDLYFYQMLKKPQIHYKIYESLRKRAIGRIKTIISIFKEDYELAQKWYGVQAENIEIITLYPYALGLNVVDEQEKNKDNYVMLLGNSGSTTNNHIEALEKMVCCKNMIEKIICPLSYGGKKSYVKSVIEKGKKLFGEKFIPLTDFMPRDEYFELLKNVDIGVFNYSRQEGLGNIWSLILSGKTIYMKMNTSTTSFFARNNIQVLDIEELKNGRMEILPKKVIVNNIYTLEPLINVEASVKKWKEILC